MSTLLDERCLTIWTSPAGKRHVEGWFSETLCSSWIGPDWKWQELTTVRWVAKIAQGQPTNTWCKRCLSNYKDVILDGTL